MRLKYLFNKKMVLVGGHSQGDALATERWLAVREVRPWPPLISMGNEVGGRWSSGCI